MRSPFLIRSLVVLSALCAASQVSAQSKPKSSAGTQRITLTVPGESAVNQKLRHAIELLRRQEEKSGEQEVVLRTLEEALEQNKKHPGLGISGGSVKATQADPSVVDTWFDVRAQDPAKSSKKDKAKTEKARAAKKARDAKKAAEKAYRAAKMQYERAIEQAENSRRLDLLQQQESQNQEQLKKVYDRAKAARVDAEKARQKAAHFITVVETADGGEYATLKTTSDRPLVTYLLQDDDHEVIKELNRSLARAKAEEGEDVFVVTGEPDAEYRVIRTKKAGGGAVVGRANVARQSTTPFAGAVTRYRKARSEDDDDNDNDDIVDAIEDVAAELRAIRKLMERVHGQVQGQHGNSHGAHADGADAPNVFFGRFEPAKEADEGGKSNAVFKWVKKEPAVKGFPLATKKSRQGVLWSTSVPEGSAKGEPQHIDALLPPAKAKVRWREVKAKAPKAEKPARIYRAMIKDEGEGASAPSPAPRLIGAYRGLAAPPAPVAGLAVPPRPAAPSPVSSGFALPPGPVGSPAPTRRSVIR